MYTYVFEILFSKSESLFTTKVDSYLEAVRGLSNFLENTSEELISYKLKYVSDSSNNLVWIN